MLTPCEATLASVERVTTKLASAREVAGETTASVAQTT